MESAASIRSTDLHLFGDECSSFVLLADGSRIYQLDEPTSQRLRTAVDFQDDEAVANFMRSQGIVNGSQITDPHDEHYPISALSLAVAQKCNLGCTYCYAQEGSFGGASRNMSLEVARRSIDCLLEGTSEGERVNLSFLGGEPLANRGVIRSATEYAAQRARDKKIEIGFSITTNGTLLTASDAEFFEEFRFAVTVSVDGIGDQHDALRPFKSGRGSYEAVVERVTPLLERQRQMQVSARVTVTPMNLELKSSLDELIRLGFHSVGFSPMLSSPTGRAEMDSPSLDTMLQEMINCGKEFEEQIIQGKRYPFSNMATALQEIHRGTHRPYPCGAGAGYFGVSAEGGLFACHRFVDDSNAEFGNTADGVNFEKQEEWLKERHVHFQEPCNSCWARYLCGGGCHHEVIHRGRPACDYIRGWLHYCLQAYVRLSKARPDFFGQG